MPISLCNRCNKNYVTNVIYHSYKQQDTNPYPCRFHWAKPVPKEPTTEPLQFYFPCCGAQYNDHNRYRTSDKYNRFRSQGGCVRCEHGEELMPVQIGKRIVERFKIEDIKHKDVFDYYRQIGSVIPFAWKKDLPKIEQDCREIRTILFKNSRDPIF
jgi:hypothetical protein